MKDDLSSEVLFTLFSNIFWYIIYFYLIFSLPLIFSTLALSHPIFYWEFVPFLPPSWIILLASLIKNYWWSSPLNVYFCSNCYLTTYNFINIYTYTLPARIISKTKPKLHFLYYFIFIETSNFTTITHYRTDNWIKNLIFPMAFISKYGKNSFLLFKLQHSILHPELYKISNLFILLMFRVHKNSNFAWNCQ